jgi:Family of unknown function (DUF6283)
VAESGAELRVRVHRHLRLYPNLTSYEIARALGAGQAVVRRQLRLMEGDGEALKVEGGAVGRRAVPRSPSRCQVDGDVSAPEPVPVTVRKEPCSTCPYRRDVPSGIWAASEYDKLPTYDLETCEQAVAGAFAPFHCHSTPEKLCAGWVGCHDMGNNLAMRLHHRDIDPAVYEYVSPVPLFASGAEAAEHGKRDLPAPGPAAVRKARQLLRLQGRRSESAATAGEMAG